MVVGHRGTAKETLGLIHTAASHCIAGDEGCLEDTSMEVWGRSALLGLGSASERQEAKGLSGAENSLRD